MIDLQRSLFGNISFPSGDVSQPWSWWYQMAPINVYQMKSSKPEVEKKIIQEGASYGKQLGRMTEVIEILVKNLSQTKLTKEDKQTIKDFGEMIGEIKAVKDGYKAATNDNVEDLLATLRYWKTHNKEDYDRVREALLKK